MTAIDYNKQLHEKLKEMAARCTDPSFVGNLEAINEIIMWQLGIMENEIKQIK